jgi:hypothetical protein
VIRSAFKYEFAPRSSPLPSSRPSRIDHRQVREMCDYVITLSIWIAMGGIHEQAHSEGAVEKGGHGGRPEIWWINSQVHLAGLERPDGTRDTPAHLKIAARSATMRPGTGSEPSTLIDPL